MPIRSVRPSDVDAILLILREVACQVPVKLSTSEQLQAMRKEINNCYLNRFSVVAVDNDGVVVGFQLAMEKIAANELWYIHLAYAGVTASAREKKVFRQLIEAEKQHGLPLFAEVKPDNKSRMDEILIHYGFQRYFLGEEKILADFRWDPK